MMEEYEFLRCCGALERTKLSPRTIQVMRSKALQDSRSALRYAIYVRQGRFPEGEKLIATNARWSEQYARQVLDGRFELGEPEIIKDGPAAESYAMFVLKRRWEEAEDAIFTSLSDPGDYYREFLDDEYYGDLPRTVKDWLIEERGACDQCGEALSSSKQNHWHNREIDGTFCSESCAEKAEEFYRQQQVEMWVEDELAHLDLSAAELQRAKRDVMHYSIEGPDDVRNALIGEGYLQGEDE